MKLASKGIQEDDTGKVALPIMHFKRIQCFEDASPFPSNVPTRSPSPCRKPENDRPRSRSPEPKEAKGAIFDQGAQAIQGAQKAEISEMKGVSPVVSPSRQKETEQSKSKPMPKPVPKAPKSPTPAASNQKQVQAVQANPAKASAQAPAKALPKPGDKQESPSPRNGHPPHGVTVARTPEKRLQPAVPEKQESSISSGIQNSSIGQRQPSPLGSSSAAPKAPQKSPRGVGAAGAPSHQKLPASARQADNQPSMKRPITPPTPSRASSAASGENTSSSRGTEVVKPRPQVSAAPSSQTMPVAAPGHRGAPKLEDRQSRSPTPVQPVQPKSSAATPVPSTPVSSGKELPGTGVSPRPPSGRPLATPASSGHQLNGLGKTPRGMQSQGGLPPPKASASSSSSGPMPAQSSSSLPARSSAPAEEDEYDNYSVYSGSSHSSSSSHHGHRKHSGSGSSSSQSDGARSRSSSSGRQCGNDFLPDISVQVRAPKTEHEDTSHAPQGRADDLCEFHVMHDDDAAVQGGTSLQQEYDQTLRRLGARRAAASEGLQRQVTDWKQGRVADGCRWHWLTSVVSSSHTVSPPPARLAGGTCFMFRKLATASVNQAMPLRYWNILKWIWSMMINVDQCCYHCVASETHVFWLWDGDLLLVLLHENFLQLAWTIWIAQSLSHFLKAEDNW